MELKRRSFLQGIAATVFAGLGISKTKNVKDSYEEFPGWHATSSMIRPADGKYLDVDEMKCFKCGRMIKIQKGFYVPGDRILCGCGNRAVFVLAAEVLF